MILYFEICVFLLFKQFFKFAIMIKLIKYLKLESSLKKLSLITKRCFNLNKCRHQQQLKEPSLLHKRLNDNTEKNILIYSNPKNQGAFKALLSTVLFGLFGFSATINHDLYKDKIGHLSKEDKDENYFKLMLRNDSVLYQFVTTTALILVGTFVSIYLLIVNKREVNKLYLLKGSKQLGIITDGLVGNEANFKVDLKNVSFSKDYYDKDATSIRFKAKKYPFKFNINNYNGIIHDMELFKGYILKKRF